MDYSYNSEEKVAKGIHIWGGWADNLSTPLKMNFAEPKVVKKVSMGKSFGMLVDDEGKLWSWGYSNQGCLGLGDTKQAKTPQPVNAEVSGDDSFVKVVIGKNHVLALTQFKTLLAWGNNEKCQLGIGRTQEPFVLVPEKVKFDSQLDIADIFATENSSYLITTAGEVYSWGENEQGQLGLSSLVNVEKPKRIESFFNTPIKTLVCNGKQVTALEGNVPDIFVDSEESEEDSQMLDEEDLEGLEEQKSAHSHSQMSKLDQSTTSRKSLRSLKSTRSSRRFPLDQFDMQCKELFAAVYEIRSSLLSIADEIYEIHSERKSQTKHHGKLNSLMNQINAIKEDASYKFEALVSNGSGNGTSETNNYKLFLRDLVKDSISLKSLEVLGIYMIHYQSQLESFNYTNLSNFIEDQFVKVPEEQKKAAALFHCKKITQKMQDKHENFLMLSKGLSSISCATMHSMTKSIISQAQLWTALSKVLSEINLKDHLDKKLFKSEECLEHIWEAYERIQAASLDAVRSQNPSSSWKGLIEKTQKRLDRGQRDLAKIKNAYGKYFDQNIKKAFKLMTENVELRRFSNDMQKALLEVSS